MADLQITVFSAAVETAKGLPIQQELVSIGGASVQSNVITGGTTYPTGKKQRTVRLAADADCWVHWGDNVTALSNGTAGIMLGSENPLFISVEAGHVVAVIERV